MRQLSILLISLFLTTAALAQKGHKITFTLNDLTNSEMLIAYHYNGKHYISDTLAVNDKGVAVLEGDEPLLNGVYLAVFPSENNQYFEFLVKEQFFSVSTSVKDMVGKIKFTNSTENEIFYADMKKMNEMRKQTELIQKQMETAQEPRKESLQDQLNRISENFKKERLALMDKYPDLLYTDILGMLREIDIPESLSDENGEEIEKGSTAKYFNKHYWDYVDFNEVGIIRSPVYNGKLKDFFNKYTSPVPDSLITAADRVLALASVNQDVFQTTLVTILNMYANSKIMGHDAVYVHLVKEYYGKNKAWWADQDQIDKLMERATSMEPTLIGKQAHDMALRDTTTTVKYQLHKVPNEYTILYIWDPECGHCKKATPLLKDFYDAHVADDIMVYAVSTTNIYDLKPWKAFIRKHNLNWINVADLYNETKFRDWYDLSSTPQVFILDKDKNIIAKRLGVEQLESFFYNYLKGNDDERYKNFNKETEDLYPHDDHDDHEGHNH